MRLGTRRGLRRLKGRGFSVLSTREPAVAEAEEGFFDDEVEEPAAEQRYGRADPEAGIAVVVDAAGLEEFVGEVDELFVGEIDRIRQHGDEAGDSRRVLVEKARGA